MTAVAESAPAAEGSAPDLESRLRAELRGEVQFLDAETNRTHRMQDVEIGVGDDVCRDGQGQQERPVDYAAPHEVVGCHQPRRARAYRNGK